MALHFPLMVNGETIGRFEAIRVSGGSNEDDVNLYAVEIHDGKNFHRLTIEIEHRYGDGAWVLLQKALAATLGAPPPEAPADV